MKIGEHRGFDRFIDRLSVLLGLAGLGVAVYSLYQIVHTLLQF